MFLLVWILNYVIHTLRCRESPIRPLQILSFRQFYISVWKFHLPSLIKLAQVCYLWAIVGSIFLPVTFAWFWYFRACCLSTSHSSFFAFAFAFWRSMPITFTKLYSGYNKQKTWPSLNLFIGCYLKCWHPFPVPIRVDSLFGKSSLSCREPW